MSTLGSPCCSTAVGRKIFNCDAGPLSLHGGYLSELFSPKVELIHDKKDHFDFIQAPILRGGDVIRLSTRLISHYLAAALWGKSEWSTIMWASHIDYWSGSDRHSLEASMNTSVQIPALHRKLHMSASLQADNISLGPDSINSKEYNLYRHSATLPGNLLLFPVLANLCKLFPVKALRDNAPRQ